MTGNGERLKKIANLVAFFRNGARCSAPAAAASLRHSEEAVRQQIRELHDAGLLRIAGWPKADRGPMFRVYEWAEPFGAPDAPYPGKEAKVPA